MMAMNKTQIRSKERKRSPIYKQITHREHQKLVENPKTEKNHEVAHTFTIIEKLQRDEEEDLTPALYNSSKFSPSIP